MIIPPRFPRHAVDHFVAQHEDWIKEKLDDLEITHPVPELPDRIFLQLDGSDVKLLNSSNSLSDDLFSETLTMPGENLIECVDGLRTWVRNKAKDLLPPRLETISKQTGLEFRKVTIRSQRSRWGSCSSSGTINLNDQLVFLPPETVDYLMIHELCHTRHMNHSRKFWTLVQSFCPQYQYHEARLDDFKQWVPDWFIWDLNR